MERIMYVLMVSYIHTVSLQMINGTTWYNIPNECSIAPDGGPITTLFCKFGRLLRKNETFPFLEGPSILFVNMTWPYNCKSGPTVEFPDGTFSRMPNLYVLHIGGCVKSHYTLNTFEGLEKLENLYISPQAHSYITTFDPDWLKPLRNLHWLEMNSTNAGNLSLGHFCGLKHLETLRLKHNHINSLECLRTRGNDFQELGTVPKACLPNLKQLDISFNFIPTLNMAINPEIPNLNLLIAQNCSISQIVGLDGEALMRFETIDLKNNKLSFFMVENLDKCNCSNMNYFKLRNNKLVNISKDLFYCTKHLKYLDMAGNLLTKEVLLDAGLQYLTRLEYLYLDYNNITVLQYKVFGNMSHLTEFSCRGCGIRSLEKYVFEGWNISRLDLSQNSLTEFEITYHVASIRELYLNKNGLQQVPIINCKGLHTLDLTDNQISIPNGVWIGNSSTRNSSSRFNRTRLTHSPIIMPPLFTWFNVKILRLGNNKISHIPDNYFVGVHMFDYLDLSNNAIDDSIEDALRWAHIKRLNLDFNCITNLNILERTLGLSHVHIRGNRVQSGRIPTGLEWIDLSHNQIVQLSKGYFQLPHLAFVNLTYNKLHRLNIFTLLAMPQNTRDIIPQEDWPSYGETTIKSILEIKGKVLRPWIFLEGNLLQCDCTNSFLMMINSLAGFRDVYVHAVKELWPFNRREYIDRYLEKLSSQNFIMIPDLETLSCYYFPYFHISPLLSLKLTDFLCPYTVDKDDGCNCCHDIGCQCCSVCLTNCTCFRGEFHNRKIMDCAAMNFTTLPVEFPNFITEIVLSSNGIERLEKGAFEKRNMNLLQRLDLSHNKINFIDDTAFANLSSLEWLLLDNNNLHLLDLTVFDNISSLMNLSLYGNPWECDCTFGPMFQDFIQQHIKIIHKPSSTYCSYYKYQSATNASTPDRNSINDTVFEPILEINFDFCKNATIQRSIEHRLHFSAVGLSVMSAVFLFIGLTVLLIYKNNLLLRVWAYNKFGTRCHHEKEDNADKPFFLAYACEDEVFVIDILLEELENGRISYTVLLEARDWPGGDIFTQMVIASVEQSKRTVLLVSENYFQSQWAQYEFQAAHMQVLKDRQTRLILVLMDMSLKARMESDMKLYLKTGIYLVYGETYFWQKLRYYLADDPRGASGGFRPLII